ncbi:hypothetical protein AB6N16_08045 [Pseudomonas marginalis]
MSVIFYSGNPKDLLADFDARIAQTEPKGKITTWKKTTTGHYTHKAADWTDKAYFFPSLEAGKLVFNLIRPTGTNISVTVYGYYHGHLTETFLNHFDQKFTTAQSSAVGTTGDNIKA